MIKHNEVYMLEIFPYARGTIKFWFIRCLEVIHRRFKQQSALEALKTLKMKFKIVNTQKLIHNETLAAGTANSKYHSISRVRRF